MGLFKKNDKNKAKVIEEPKDDFPEDEEESDDEELKEIEEEDRKIQGKIKKLKSGASEEELEVSGDLTEKEMKLWMQNIELRLQGLERHSILVGIRD